METVTMSLVSMSWSLRPDPVLEGEHVMLRRARRSDYADWAELRAQSRAWLAPWEPLWRQDELSKASFQARLKAWQEDTRNGLAAPFLVFRQQDKALVGGANLSSIRRGVAQDCSLGYWIGAPFARQGYTSEAVRLVVAHAFSELGLHRVQAACVPTNERSSGLLRKLGFTQEGYARKYLRINGAWADHLLFAKLSDDQ
jgi:[ribosomal protein S5]-alanine N-acetyltransferase